MRILLIALLAAFASCSSPGPSIGQKTATVDSGAPDAQFCLEASVRCMRANK